MGRRSGRSPAQAWGPAEVEVVRSLARSTDVEQAVAALEDALPQIAAGPAEVHVLALHAHCVLLRATGADVGDLAAALEDLEQTAARRRVRSGRALARAESAHVRLAEADVPGAVTSLAGAYAEALDTDPGSPTCLPLVESVADALARTPLVVEHATVRERLDEVLLGARDLPRYAAHRSRWAAATAVAALHPTAFGAREPDATLLDRAVGLLPHEDVVPTAATDGELRVARSGAAVRALVATYRDQPSDALRLLGRDAFGSSADLDPVVRHVATLAAVRAHAQVGSIGSARSLDDAATRAGESGLLVPALVRARERLWLETHARGDIDAPARRVTALTAALARESLDVARMLGGLALRGHPVGDDDPDFPAARPGRRALVAELRRLLREGRLPVALVLVDVDDLAGVNDRHSPVVGDEVLRRVSATLRAQLRAGDRLVRCSQDEFALLLPGTGDEQARHVALRVGEQVRRRSWAELADGLEITVTSGCAALWSAEGRRPDADAERLVDRAGEALREAVAARRDRADGEPADGEPADGGPDDPSGRSHRARRAAGPPAVPARRAADVRPAPAEQVHAGPAEPSVAEPSAAESTVGEPPAAAGPSPDPVPDLVVDLVDRSPHGDLVAKRAEPEPEPAGSAGPDEPRPMDQLGFVVPPRRHGRRALPGPPDVDPAPHLPPLSSRSVHESSPPE